MDKFLKIDGQEKNFIGRLIDHKCQEAIEGDDFQFFSYQARLAEIKDRLERSYKWKPGKKKKVLLSISEFHALMELFYTIESDDPLTDTKLRDLFNQLYKQYVSEIKYVHKPTIV